MFLSHGALNARLLCLASKLRLPSTCIINVAILQARNWVAKDLQVDPDTAVNLFETTIRVLGGLLAAFHLSNGDKVMLYKAASLALRMLPAFGSESGDHQSFDLRISASPPYVSIFSGVFLVYSSS